MRTVSINLPETLDSLDIHVLGDWHVGDPLRDYDTLACDIDRIVAAPNALCVLGGDLCDMALRNSVGDVYGNDVDPMGQVEAIVDLLSPIKDKIVCMVRGNHENRVYKQTGVDPLAFAAVQLGISDRYSETSALAFIAFGHDTKHGGPLLYTLYAVHGSGGGRKIGGKLQAAADLVSVIDCDIYCHNHVHLPGAFKTATRRIDYGHKKVTYAEHLFVTGGSTLEYGGYAEAGAMSPPSKSHPVIHLTSGKKRFSATIL